MSELVSVIVPAYNVGKFIRKCLCSIMEQTYSNLEIIVINDGSTDDTKTIIKDLLHVDKRIIFIDRENKGVSASRNEGISVAKGAWLVFVDGDDYLASDYVEHMLDIANTTGAEFCMSTNCFKSDSDKQVENVSIISCSSDEATSLLLSEKVDVGCWNKMFKKELLERTGIRFDTCLFYGEGLYFITNLSESANNVGISNKYVYYYRQDNNTSATKHFDVEKIVNGWLALDYIEKKLSSDMPLSKRMLIQHRYLFSFTAIKKIIDSNTKSENRQLFKFHLRNIRKNFFSFLRNKTLSKKYKIRLFICCISPCILPVYRHFQRISTK